MPAEAFRAFLGFWFFSQWEYAVTTLSFKFMHQCLVSLNDSIWAQSHLSQHLLSADLDQCLSLPGLCMVVLLWMQKNPRVQCVLSAFAYPMLYSRLGNMVLANDNHTPIPHIYLHVYSKPCVVSMVIYERGKKVGSS